ncbi:MAG TPA: DUF4412 domain-containing protein [Bacteroidia bacterium]|jgi:hypothetical protein|nr:DUF4412 domain-containing protein [Bacteroidia bacterium]
MLRRILPLFILCFTTALHAQTFEGVMEVKKQTGKDVVNYEYFIKGDKVRIDEFAPDSRIVSGSFIINTKIDTMKYLLPDRKLWGTRVSKGGLAAPAGAAVVATKKTKELFGYKCSEQVVTVAADSSKISYWITPGKFNFFMPMLKMLNRQENFSTYYAALTGLKDGSMPLLAIWTDLKGVEKGRLEVTRLEAKTVNDNMFTIPSDYTEVK